ncbi:sensor histidine kinase [Streptomyces sp. NPDC058657]|uniref:sensor histidine kinase n=1 Tax=unclassified Streptomyces TaxID=2593676 RepID=UPI0036549460
MVGLGVLRDRSFHPDRKDVLPAVALFLLGAFLYLVGWYPFFRDVHTLALWNLSIAWRLIPLACACVAVLVRRHLPLPALGAGLVCCVADVLMGFSISMLLVVSELLYSATLHGSRRQSRTLIRGVIALVVAVTTVLLWTVGDWQVAVLLILLMLTIVFVPVWWAMTVRQEREEAEAARTRARQQARIAELDRRTAVSEERARMARNLHDVIAGHLSAIAIQSDAVGTMASDGQAVNAVLRSIRKNSVEALTEMRAMIELLRGQNADEQQMPQASPPRLADLDVLLDSARATGLDVSLTTPEATPKTPWEATPDAPGEANAEPAAVAAPALPPAIPTTVDLAAYRIVQEALTNAAKHAAGSRAWVAVHARDGDLHVEVTSKLTDAKEPALPGAGTGLLNMRERAAAIGGTVSAAPADGCWRVHAVLPLGPEREHEHS